MSTTPATLSKNPIGNAHMERMLRDAKDDIVRLLPDAARRTDHCLFVYDPEPRNSGDTSPRSADHQELIALAKGRPLTALLPSKLVAHMIRDLEMGHIVKRITTDRLPKVVPIVVSFGEYFGMAFADPELAARSEGLKLNEREVLPCEGGGGYMLSLSGALKMYLDTSEDEIKPDSRVLHRSFVARAKSALAAEEIRANPRDPGDVLIAAFGGDRLRQAFNNRGADGLFDVLTAELATSTAN